MKTIFKKNGGFTLVELIVVIAILAILAAVAVPAYSGYIEKANKQADISLISDIEQALILAGYNGTFGDGEAGYIVLSTDGIVNADLISENLDKAMKDTFGTNYKDSLKLSYDGWSTGVFGGMSGESAYLVKESSFMTGSRSDDLLNDVETMTNMAANLVDSMVGGGNGALANMSFSNLFKPDNASSSVLDETAVKYGISKNDGESWEDWADRTGNEAQLSNMLVLSAADEYNKYMDDPDYEMSNASKLIMEFSSYYAYAATDPTFSEKLNIQLQKLKDGEITNAEQGKQWYADLQSAAGTGYDAYRNNGELAEMDQLAFTAILSGIGTAAGEQSSIIKSDLSNPNLFTSGAANGIYNDYLTAVDAVYDAYMNGGNQDFAALEEGNVGVAFVQNGGLIKVVKSLTDD